MSSCILVPSFLLEYMVHSMLNFPAGNLLGCHISASVHSSSSLGRWYGFISSQFCVALFSVCVTHHFYRSLALITSFPLFLLYAQDKKNFHPILTKTPIFAKRRNFHDAGFQVSTRPMCSEMMLIIVRVVLHCSVGASYHLSSFVSQVVSLMKFWHLCRVLSMSVDVSFSYLSLLFVAPSSSCI
jgi:hypothetical protein